MKLLFIFIIHEFGLPASSILNVGISLSNYSPNWLLHGFSVLVSLILVSLTLVASLVSSVLLILVSILLWAVSCWVTHFSTFPTVTPTHFLFLYLCCCINWSRLTLFLFPPLWHKKHFLWGLMQSISIVFSVLPFCLSWSFDINCNLFCNYFLPV